MTSQISCTRKFHICAGHRVLGHEGKCQQPHGHNYTIYATAEPHVKLDDLGRVIDFSVIKKILGDWLEENWDHQFILFKDDKELLKRLKGFSVYVLPMNPTAENLGLYLLRKCEDLFAVTRINITTIEIWETDNCLATIKRDHD